MNLSIFKGHDPSGKMCKESYVLKNYNDEYNYILDYCNFNNIFDIPFKEKVYLCIHNLSEIPICNNHKCSNKVKFINSTLGYRKYCSNKCISSDPIIKEIKRIKSMDKFGTKTPSESDIIRCKIINTNIRKYGGNSPMSSKNIQDKSKNKLLKNHGVDNPSKSQILLDKRISSFRLSNYRENYIRTSLERYGVENPLMIKSIHHKGVVKTSIIKDQKFKKTIINKLINYPEYQLLYVYSSNGKRIIKIKCKICDKTFKISREDLHARFINKTTICTNCNPINSIKSGTEFELFKFINDNYKGEVIRNSRNVIYPMELDIYIPKLKIAFEFNGLYWHSELKKEKNYHINKTDRCKMLDIELIHIWEDDWVFKQNIIKSIILYKLKLL